MNSANFNEFVVKANKFFRCSVWANVSQPFHVLLVILLLIISNSFFTLMTGIIIWIVTGILVGWIAFLAVRKEGEQSVMPDMGAGVVGGLVGGWFTSYVSKADMSSFDLYSFIAALIGAIVFIVIVRAIK